MNDRLDVELLAAHSAGDGAALARLYARAADQFEKHSHIDGTCFYLTQAYIFALEAGLPEASECHRRLVAYGRDTLQRQGLEQIEASRRI